MHTRNPHQGRYDFAALCEACPELQAFLKESRSGDQTLDFSDPRAVLCLNRALLAAYYSIKYWAIPDGYLCPAVPGRADYIHHLADLISQDSIGARILDVGTGANCIYPILGSSSYGWKFVGSDVDRAAIKSARLITEMNSPLKKHVRIVQKRDRSTVFDGVIRPSDRFAAVMCNPPFHDSQESAAASTARKVGNLSKGKANSEVSSNFGGQANELWCEGGEVQFIKKMIDESRSFAKQVGWFTCLVSKSEHLPVLKGALQSLAVAEVRVVQMEQGSKQSRFLAWRFSAD